MARRFSAEDEEPEISLLQCVKSVAWWKAERNKCRFESLIHEPSGWKHEIYLGFSCEPSRSLFLVAGWSASGSIGCQAIKTKVTGPTATTAKLALHHRRPCVSEATNTDSLWIISPSAAPTPPQLPQCSVYHVKLWHVMFHSEGKHPTWPILPTDLHPAARRTLTSAGRRGSSSLTKPHSQITHFLSLRFLPFKAKPPAPDWVRLEKSVLNTCRLWLGVSRAAPQAEKHMCPSNANQTPRTFQLPAFAVWTCGAAWKTALEGLGRTQWGLLAVFRALTLVPSYLYDPSWPLAGLATTKAPKTGRRWMEGRSKRNWKTEKGGKRWKKKQPKTFFCY